MSFTKLKTKRTLSSSSSKVSSPPTSVSDYTILPLSIPPTSSYPVSTTHYVYLRPHAPKIPDANSARSLFVANVPIDATEASIRTLFAEQLGGSRVSHVEFDSSVPALPTVKRWKDGPGSGAQARLDESAEDALKRGKKRKRDEDVVAEGVVESEETRLPKTWARELRTSGSSAVVVFVDKASAKGAMSAVEKAVRKGKEIIWTGGAEEDEALGETRYLSHHALTFPSKSSLQSSINAYLTAFNHAELARNRLRAKQRAVPDEDGFITVVRGGRAGPARLEEAEAAKEKLAEREKKKGAKEDFYRFQVREKRKEREGELRRKFEEDKRRVSEMRERRGKVMRMS